MAANYEKFKSKYSEHVAFFEKKMAALEKD